MCDRGRLITHMQIPWFHTQVWYNTPQKTLVWLFSMPQSLHICQYKRAISVHFTYNLWSHNWNLVPNPFDWILIQQIRSQICVCHDSWAVVTCAKLWPDRMIIFHVWYAFLQDLNYQLINCLSNELKVTAFPEAYSIGHVRFPPTS